MTIYFMEAWGWVDPWWMYPTPAESVAVGLQLRGLGSRDMAEHVLANGTTVTWYVVRLPKRLRVQTQVDREIVQPVDPCTLVGTQLRVAVETRDESGWQPVAGDGAGGSGHMPELNRFIDDSWFDFDPPPSGSPLRITFTMKDGSGEWQEGVSEPVS